MQRSALETRLTLTYLLALGFIALLTVVSYLIIRASLQSKEDDARLINLVGRQATLAEKIIKTSLLLENPQRNVDFSRDLLTLALVLREWQQDRQTLEKGDAEQGIAVQHSPDIQNLLNRSRPHYASILRAAEIVALLRPTNDAQTFATLRLAVDTLLTHENRYISLMRDIASRYDREANTRLERNKWWEFWLMLITLAVLVLEARFVFQPVVRRTAQFFHTIQGRNAELSQLNAQLKASEETNRQKTEEIRASEEEIRQNMEELAAINESLMRSTDELRQKNDILHEATQLLDIKNREIRRNRDHLFEKSKQLEAKNEAISNSIRYARRIQEAILPEANELYQTFPEAFIFYHPRDIVSGDFFWFSDRNHCKVIIAADCTGHGVPGALMTMMGNALINEIVNEKGITDPAEILHELDRKIVRTLQRPTDVDKKPIHDGMDVAVMSIDMDKYVVQFAAAHNPLYYFRDGEMQQVKGSKFPVGSAQYGDKSFEMHEIQAAAGEVFYIFTDGFQDQFGELEQRKYMSKRFRQFLATIAHLSMKEQLDCLQNELDTWRGNANQTDDVLVIGVKL